MSNRLHILKFFNNQVVSYMYSHHIFHLVFSLKSILLPGFPFALGVGVTMTWDGLEDVVDFGVDEWDEEGIIGFDVVDLLVACCEKDVDANNIFEVVDGWLSVAIDDCDVGWVVDVVLFVDLWVLVIVVESVGISVL